MENIKLEKLLTDNTIGLGNQLGITLKNYSTIIYSDAYGNCKHCYFDCLGGALGNKAIEDTVKAIDKITRRKQKTTFSVNLNYVTQIETLQKHFKMINCVSIPTGYGNNYQFHAIFFVNHNSRNMIDYLARFQTYGLGPEIKTNIKLTERATPKPIGPGEVTDEIVDKVFSYKTKVWLKKYLIKLIG